MGVGIIMKKIDKTFVIDLSKKKNEPDWMKEFRLESLRVFNEFQNPNFGPNLDIDFEQITYYKENQKKMTDNWEEVDKNIRGTFCDLGVIKAEQDYLFGVTNQYESEVVYHNIKDKESGVIFTSTDEALKKYPELFKKYFNNLVKYTENKYTALNGAFWSGGSFIYIPKHVKLDRPLQSYFRINSRNMGQFERTLIVVDDDSSLHYVEGCTAPTYSESSLHAAVVEIHVGRGSKCRYSTIQNWASNVYNLVTKRAEVLEDGEMEWIDGNIGSYKTMKYPCCLLKGDRSQGTCITISVASYSQEQDSGARMIHLGRDTKSNIISKSIAQNGGNATYRGKVLISKDALASESIVKCDTLILDGKSKSDTIVTNSCHNKSSNIEHEATVSKISDDNLFYLMSRGISKEEAMELIVLGFLEKFRSELPMEYAVELNQLIKRNL